MHRQAAVTGALVLSVAIIVTAARALGGAQFGPAQAASSAAAAPALDASAIVDLPETMHLVSVVEPAAVAASAPASAATAPSEEPAPAPAVIAAAPAPAPVVRTPAPVVAAAPVAPAPVAPAPVAPAPAPVTTTCPAGSWFCYPRLGISGAIVPYSDCTGSTDVGTQIRSFTCLSNSYLMAHAYTQFGKITGWQAGDTVIAYGRTFTVTGAFVQSACTQPRMPLAPLEMQTSLTPYSCGDVLVVQAN